MAAKTVKILGEELEKLEKYRDEAIAQREQNPQVTIKGVGSGDIILDNNQQDFFNKLIDNLNLTIDQTKRNIQEIMFPTKTPERG